MVVSEFDCVNGGTTPADAARPHDCPSLPASMQAAGATARFDTLPENFAARSQPCEACIAATTPGSLPITSMNSHSGIASHS